MVGVWPRPCLTINHLPIPHYLIDINQLTQVAAIIKELIILVTNNIWIKPDCSYNPAHQAHPPDQDLSFLLPTLWLAGCALLASSSEGSYFYEVRHLGFAFAVWLWVFRYLVFTVTFVQQLQIVALVVFPRTNSLTVSH